MSLHTTPPEPRPSRALVEAALFLSQQWPVFACDSSKRPITAHGFKDATQDPATIRAMFGKPGAALIGVPTGAASDLAVIDLDVKHNAPGLEWLAANRHRLPATPCARLQTHQRCAQPRQRSGRHRRRRRLRRCLVGGGLSALLGV